MESLFSIRNNNQWPNVMLASGRFDHSRAYGAQCVVSPFPLNLLAAAFLIALTLFFADVTVAAAQASNHIDAGDNHACMITSSGGVQCWGYNNSGQLGDGTTTTRDAPVNVVGINDAVSILVDLHTSCVLTAGGGVKCWGGSPSNQHLTPVDISGMTSGVIAIGGHAGDLCAITTGGGVLCTTNTFIAAPTAVGGLSSGVIAVAGLSGQSGGGARCALLNTGGVKCWGQNYSGQLGNGTFTNNFTPGDVTGLTSGVVGIAGAYNDDGAGGVSYATFCAVLQNGSAKCWGANGDGRLGTGSTDKNLRANTPVDVTGLSASAVAIRGSGSTFCVLLVTAAVECWGGSGAGVGAGNDLHSASPTPGMDGLTTVSEIAVGDGWPLGSTNFSCVILTDGDVRCTGQNYAGALGAALGTGLDPFYNVYPAFYTMLALSGGSGAAMNVPMSISKSDPMPYPPVAGQPVSYNIVVTNTGASDLTNVTVTDLAGPGLGAMTAFTSSPAGICNTATYKCTLSSALAPGAIATFNVTFNTSATPGTVITNSAYVNADEWLSYIYLTNPPVDAKTVSTVDLAITKSASLTQATSGTTFDYTLTVVNNGPDAATNVVAVDVLPAGFTFNSATATGGGSCSESGGIVTCTWPTVGNGTTVTATINVTS